MFLAAFARFGIAQEAATAQEQPNHKKAAILYDRAQAKEAEGNLKGAIADFDQAILLDSGYADAYDARGYAKSRGGDLDGAMSDYDRALALNPKDAITYNNRGNAEAARDDLEHAVADYNESIRFDLRLAHAYNGRGNVCLKRDDLDQAITDFTEAVHLDPMYGHAYNGRGLAELEQANFDDALNDFSEAIRLDPNYAHAYANRGAANFVRNHPAEARPDLEHAIDLDATDVESRLLAWLVLSRDPDRKGGADADLRAFSQREDVDPWSQELAKFLLGDLSQDQLLKSAFTEQGQRRKEQLCQAYFYMAAKAELAGDVASADNFYRQSTGTGVTAFADFILATVKIATEPSAVPSPSMPPAVWINGQVKQQGDIFLFTTDKPVRDDSMGNIVLLDARPGMTGTMTMIYSRAAQRHLTVRFYGCLITFNGKIKDEAAPVPNIEFIVWKIHEPGEPDVLPENQKIHLHDKPAY